MARPDYRDLTKEQFVELLEARDRRKFGLVWERNAIEHDQALNDGVEQQHRLIVGGDFREMPWASRLPLTDRTKCSKERFPALARHPTVPANH